MAEIFIPYTIQTLIELLTKNRQSLEQLSQTLVEERQCCESVEHYSLTAILQKKEMVIKEIMLSQHRLIQYLDELGYPALNQKFQLDLLEKLLIQTPDSLKNQLKEAWTQLKLKLHETHYLNSVNEKIVQHRKHVTDH